MNDFSAGGARNLAETFRRLYYQLYSNSSTSRAERLLENLATILLLKFSLDKLNGHEELKVFLSGQGTADALLKDFLRRQHPKKSALSFSFSLSDNSIREAMMELDHLDLSIAPAHILGEAFQALIGPRLRGTRASSSPRSPWSKRWCALLRLSLTSPSGTRLAVPVGSLARPMCSKSKPPKIPVN